MTDLVAAQAAVLTALAEVATPTEVWPDARIDDLALSHDALDHAAERINALLGTSLDERALEHRAVREVVDVAAAGDLALAA
jgi:hypothetical protein